MDNGSRPPFDIEQFSFPCEWWVNGELLGIVDSADSGDSIAFICEEKCEHRAWGYKRFPGRQWGRFYVPCEHHWQTARITCVPGSMLLWFPEREMALMPDAILEREYQLHLAHFDRRMQRGNETSGDTRKPQDHFTGAGLAASLAAELEGGPKEVDRQRETGAGGSGSGAPQPTPAA